MPGATLKMTVRYQFLWFHKLREFNFYAVFWGDGTYRWEYGTVHQPINPTITLSGSNVHYTGR